MAKSATKAPRAQKQRPADRILNRELSALTLNERVLELAADPTQPLLERVRFCSICLGDARRVLHDPDRRAARPGGGRHQVRSPDGRTAAAGARRDARERVLELTRRNRKLWAGELCPALAAEGIVDRLRRRPLDARPRAARAAIRARDLPGAHAARRRPGPAVPVHLAALDQRRRASCATRSTGEERFARLKVPEGLPRFLARTATASASCRSSSVLAHFLPTLFPGMDVVERSRVPRDARCRLRGLGRGRRPARGGRDSSCGDGRFGDVVRLEVSESMSAAMRRADPGRPSDRRRPRLSGATALLDLAELSELAELDRPDLKVDRWVPVARPPLALLDARTCSSRFARGDAARPASVRLVRRDHRVLRRARRRAIRR